MHPQPSLTLTHELLLRRSFFRHARSIGPSVATITENIWSSAISAALWDIQRLLSFADTCSAARLEAAAARALFHAHGNLSTVDHILSRHLDSLPLSRYTDLDGNLLFPLPPASDPSIVLSHLARENFTT